MNTMASTSSPVKTISSTLSAYRVDGGVRPRTDPTQQLNTDRPFGMPESRLEPVLHAGCGGGESAGMIEGEERIRITMHDQHRQPVAACAGNGIDRWQGWWVGPGSPINPGAHRQPQIHAPGRVHHGSMQPAHRRCAPIEPEGRGAHRHDRICSRGYR